jgi:hypothetical protein
MRYRTQEFGDEAVALYKEADKYAILRTDQPYVLVLNVT